MSHDEHRVDRVGLADLIFRQQRGIEPARAGDARGLHQRLVGEAGADPVVLHLPDPAPVPPGLLGKAVVERQRRHVEPEVGRALDVGVAAENIGAAAGVADIAGGEQQDAAGPDIGRAGRELGLSHRPDQRRRFLFGEDLGDVPDLRLREAGDALDLGGRPLRHLGADLVHAVDALAEEFLVFPAILEDVPEHPVDRRDMGAGTDADIFRRMGRGPRHPGIDDDHVRAVEFLALENVLQRDRVSFRRVAAHDEDGLGIADVVVAVGHRAVAPGIGDAGDRGGVTDARLVIGIVGAPEGGELAIEIGGLVGELGGAQPIDRVRSRFLPDLQQLVADLVDRLIPAEPGPLSLHQLHRIAQAALAQYVVADCRAFAAMGAPVDRAVVVGLLADPDVVSNLGHNGAADRAMGADILAAGHRRARGRWRPGFGFAYAGQRQAAKCRQSSRGEAGTAQKCPPIQAACRLVLRRRGKCRVVDAPLCLLLDKQGRLPHRTG